MPSELGADLSAADLKKILADDAAQFAAKGSIDGLNWGNVTTVANDVEAFGNEATERYLDGLKDVDKAVWTNKVCDALASSPPLPPTIR